MVKSNLVPVPRTDKNGRTVIRHMRPGSPSVQGGKALPAPSPIVEPDSIAAMASELQALADHAGYGEEVDFADFVGAEGKEHLANLHSLLMEFPEDGQAKLLGELVDIVGIGDKEAVTILLGHREYLIRNPLDAEQVVDMHRRLKNTHAIAPDPETGRITTLVAHLDAERHYTPQYRSQNGVSFMLHYRDNLRYVAAVERHVDRLAELLAYRSMRGITVHGEGYAKVDGFDEEDFHEYLNHGALGNGML